MRTGGTAGGNVNDRILLKAEGIVYTTTATQTRTTLASLGTVAGWDAQIAISGSDMLFKVTGALNMNISWSCTLNLYEVII